MYTYNKISGKLTSEDAEEIVQAAIASQRLEGLETPSDEADMLLAYARGDITEGEYLAWVWKRAGGDVMMYL